MKKRFVCDICTKDYKYRHHLRRHHVKHHEKYVYVDKYECCHCNKKCVSASSLAGHTTNCLLNPIREQRLLKLSLACKGRILSEEHKMKLSKTINQKIAKDEWHNSFRKSSKMKLNGEIFDGKWEILIAETLSKLNIKWERNKQRFKYFHEEIERSYLPDFYLPEFDVYIEVKGYATKKDESKWNQFPKILKVISGKFINDLFPEIIYRDNWKISVQNKRVEVL